MANRIHDALDCIHADTRLKEAVKQQLAAERMKKTQPGSRNKTFHRLLATACIALFLIVGVSSYAWIQAPVSYVSIDVNPSIELALNRFDRVVSATAFNKSGEEILKHLSLKGKKYTDAIDAIVYDKAMNVYLTDDSEFVFTVASKSRYDELKTGVEKCSDHIEHTTHHVSADMEFVSTAHDNGVSLGKYYAWLQLAQYDDEITIDECRNMSMSRIHHILHKHEQENTEVEDHQTEDTRTEHTQTEDHHEAEHHKTADIETEEHKTEDIETEDHKTDTDENIMDEGRGSAEHGCCHEETGYGCE